MWWCITWTSRRSSVLTSDADLLLGLSGDAGGGGLAVLQVAGRQAELPVRPAGVLPLAEQHPAVAVAQDQVQVDA